MSISFALTATVLLNRFEFPKQLFYFFYVRKILIHSKDLEFNLGLSCKLGHEFSLAMLPLVGTFSLDPFLQSENFAKIC